MYKGKCKENYIETMRKVQRSLLKTFDNKIVAEIVKCITYDLPLEMLLTDLNLAIH